MKGGSSQPFLRELGRRLRAARRAQGLGLAELADRADVSRRYLTETEAGRANPSALVLARLARAVGLSLSEWLDIPMRSGRPERVALLGLRGAGKSSVGRLLALALEVPFVELDQEIERDAGLELAAIFDLHGTEGFHRFEAEALERVLARGERMVLAAGGSIVESPATFERLLETCRTVWLRAEPEEHLARVQAQGDRRPMHGHPRALDELRAILERRGELYGRCELVQDTSGRTADEVAAELADELDAPAASQK